MQLTHFKRWMLKEYLILPLSYLSTLPICIIEECIIKALELCLTNNNSIFAGQNLIQTNGEWIGEANFWSFSELAVQPMDYAVIIAQRKKIQEILCFERYRDDSIAIWTRDAYKVNILPDVLNSVDENLKFAIKIGGSLKIKNYDKNV